MSAYKVIAFDCDGVMFDTDKANQAYYNDLLAVCGLPPMTGEQFEYAQMQTVEKSIQMLFPNEQDRIKAHAHRKIRGYTPYIKLMEMEPDLVALLANLRPVFNTAVATNRTDTMKSVLETHQLESYFDVVATALDVQNPKPAPDVLLCLLRHFEINADEMLYIGDSVVDQKSARAAGVRFCAYGNRKLDADYHITRLREVKTICAG